MDLMLNRSIVPMPNNTELGTNIVGMNVDDAVTTLEGGKVPFLGAEEFSFFQSLSSENRAKFVLNRIEALTAINGQARASAHVGCASLLKSIASKYPQLHHDYYYLFQTNSGASIALNRHERRAQAKRQKLAR